MTDVEIEMNLAFERGRASRDAEIESILQQLADSQKREVMLRDALRSAADTLWHFAPAKTADKAEEALAATEPKE